MCVQQVCGRHGDGAVVALLTLDLPLCRLRSCVSSLLAHAFYTVVRTYLQLASYTVSHAVHSDMMRPIDKRMRPFDPLPIQTATCFPKDATNTAHNRYTSLYNKVLARTKNYMKLTCFPTKDHTEYYNYQIKFCT